MPNSNRNRNSQKSNEDERRTGNRQDEKVREKKLPGNPDRRPDESISTADNTANGKYSRTGKRDDDVNNEDTRGGR